MNDKPVSVDHAGTYTGTMIADTIKQRLDAHPIQDKKINIYGS